MRAFAQKPKATQQTASAESTISGQAHFGQSSEVNSILRLQRMIGNQAVQRLLKHAQPDDLKVSSGTTAVPRFGHESAGCRHSQPSVDIQAKMKVSTPEDVYEQEADRVSERVMCMPEPKLERTCACGGGCPRCQTQQLVHRQESLQTKTKRVQDSDTRQTTEPPIIHETLSSPGQSFDPATRLFMESRFGHDFSSVRVHADRKAADSAQVVNAQAYTVGHDIVFGPGQYSPTAPKGQKLIAHELTHVLQQQASVPGNGSRQNERTLQRAFCLGGRRRADTDETALHAFDKIERAYNAFLVVADDPSVDMNIKLDMRNATKNSIVALKAYIKEIEGQCSSSSGAVSPMLGQAGTAINPLHAAVALFAFLLVADSARRISMSEQRSVKNLGNALVLLAAVLEALTRTVKMPEPEPIGPGPIKPIPPIPFPETAREPRPHEDKPRGDERKRPRRKRCDTEWVPREAYTQSQEYHNDFAEQMVVDLNIIAPPGLEWRVYAKNMVFLDYDSYDTESGDFFEFKTRYDYLPYERLGVTWFATSNLVAQARHQKEIMTSCGFTGELVWVFDNEAVANAARPYLEGTDAADRVIAGRYR